VDRKLVYVEPTRERPEFEDDANEKPDAIQNALTALSTLPSYQWIRDDIRRVLDRNVLLKQVERILKGLEQDFDQRRLRDCALADVSGAEFLDTTLDEMIEKMGPSRGRLSPTSRYRNRKRSGNNYCTGCGLQCRIG